MFSVVIVFWVMFNTLWPNFVSQEQLWLFWLGRNNNKKNQFLIVQLVKYPECSPSSASALWSPGIPATGTKKVRSLILKLWLTSNPAQLWHHLYLWDLHPPLSWAEIWGRRKDRPNYFVCMCVCDLLSASLQHKLLREKNRRGKRFLTLTLA